MMDCAVARDPDLRKQALVKAKPRHDHGYSPKKTDKSVKLIIQAEQLMHRIHRLFTHDLRLKRLIPTFPIE